MGRRRAELRVEAPGSPAKEALDRHRAPGKSARAGELWVRCTPDGQVKARVVSSDPSHGNPHFKGRVEPHGNGSVLLGTIHESRVQTYHQRMFELLALVMVGVLALALLDDQPDVSGGVVGALGAVAFGAIGVLLRKLRKHSFPVAAEDLRRVVGERIQPNRRRRR